MGMLGIIYRCTNIINGKIYIGKTVHKNPNTYFNTHFSNALNNKDKKQRHFYNAIRKYGKDKFEFSILESNLSKSELVKRETYYIQTLKSYDRDIGYNMTTQSSGGDTANKKGKTWDAYYGVVKANEIRAKKRNTVSQKDYTEANVKRGHLKGKTYEEVYGANTSDKVKKQRADKMRETVAIFNHSTDEDVVEKRKAKYQKVSDRLSNKTLEQIYGKDKANEMLIKAKTRVQGCKNPMANTYKLISPQDDVFVITGCLKQFCKDHNISYQMISKKGLKLGGAIEKTGCGGNFSIVGLNTIGWKITKQDKEK